MHESTGYSPSMMMFGRGLNLPTDLVTGQAFRERQYITCDYALELELKLQNIHELARKRIRLPSDRQKRKYDHRVQLNTFMPGELVLLYNLRNKPGKCSKLCAKWSGYFFH